MDKQMEGTASFMDPTSIYRKNKLESYLEIVETYVSSSHLGHKSSWDEDSGAEHDQVMLETKENGLSCVKSPQKNSRFTEYSSDN